MRPLLDLYANDRSRSVWTKRLHSLLPKGIAHAYNASSFAYLALLCFYFRVSLNCLCDRCRGTEVEFGFREEVTSAQDRAP